MRKKIYLFLFLYAFIADLQASDSLFVNYLKKQDAFLWKKVAENNKKENTGKIRPEDYLIEYESKFDPLANGVKGRWVNGGQDFLSNSNKKADLITEINKFNQIGTTKIYVLVGQFFPEYITEKGGLLRNEKSNASIKMMLELRANFANSAIKPNYRKELTDYEQEGRTEIEASATTNKIIVVQVCHGWQIKRIIGDASSEVQWELFRKARILQYEKVAFSVLGYVQQQQSISLFKALTDIEVAKIPLGDQFDDVKEANLCIGLVKGVGTKISNPLDFGAILLKEGEKSSPVSPVTISVPGSTPAPILPIKYYHKGGMYTNTPAGWYSKEEYKEIIKPYIFACAKLNDDFSGGVSPHVTVRCIRYTDEYSNRIYEEFRAGRLFHEDDFAEIFAENYHDMIKDYCATCFDGIVPVYIEFEILNGVNTLALRALGKRMFATFVRQYALKKNPNILAGIWRQITITKSATKVDFMGVGFIDDAYIKKQADGFLTAYIEIKDGLINGVEWKNKKLASKMFDEAIDHFGVNNVNGIRAEWLDIPGISDNFDIFKAVYNATNNVTEAAFETPTGKIARKKGFIKVDLTLPFNQAKFLAGEVVIKFIR